MNPLTARLPPNLPAWCLFLMSIGIGGPTVTACGNYATVDDYRESAVVVRGRLSASAAVDSGTQVSVSAIEPSYVDGVIVEVVSDGTFEARPSSFGVGSFDASLRLIADGSAGGQPFVRETTLTDVRFWEDRGGKQPDTVALVWDVSAP
jgi:hypothetical protein